MPTSARTALGYDIGRFSGHCALSGAPLPPGTPCVTALFDDPQGPGFVRRDYALDAWEALAAAAARSDGADPPGLQGLYSWWRGVAPSPDAPRRILVDDQTLLDIFLRLEADDAPSRQAFRFVLALVLLRRRMLRSVGRDRSAGREVWLLLPRGAVEGTPALRVVDPGLAEADLDALGAQLGEILAEGAA